MLDNMYLCRICNEQVVGDDRALSMHMKTHDIPISATSSIFHHNGMLNVNSKCSNEKDRPSASSLFLLSNGSLKPFTLLIKAGSKASMDGNQATEKPFLDQAMHNGGNKEGLIDLLDDDNDKANSNEVVRGTFECRACNKVFYSHQALGGHRASHKKIKGCFAAAYLNHHDQEKKNTESREQNVMMSTKLGESLDLNPSNPSQKGIKLQGNPLSLTSTTPKKKSKTHECSICHRVFPSGQALGGHKRCHWLPSSVSSDTHPFYSVSTFHNFLDEGQPPYKKTKFVTCYYSKPLDLNQLPLPLDHELYKAPNDKLRVDVESQLYGLGPSATTNFLGDHRGMIRRDINSVYHNWCHYNSEHYKGKISDNKLKDNHIDGLRSTWLQLGIGSS